MSLAKRSLGILAVILAGCASVPNVNPVVDSAGSAKPHLVGPRGPLTAAQSRAILAKLQREAGDSDVLQRHLALEGALDDNPIAVGNKVTVLPSGADALTAIFDAISNAHRDINLEYYTFENVQENGRNVGDLILAQRQKGLQVNLIYDSFGSAGTPDQFLATLKDAGVSVVDFNPMNPLEARHGWKPNNRDHRKILVADGDLAIIGGVNISRVYASTPFHQEESSKSVSWKDTDVKIEGPAAAELQKLFLSTWQSQGGTPLDESRMFPKIPAQGDEVVHVLGSSPTQPAPNYYASLISAIRNAENRIWISAAYFVPTRQEVRDLVDAAHRGVDVKLLLPGKTDSPLSLNAGRGNYTHLMSHGIDIYETQDAVLHSKTAVVDSVWSAIGSSNFDHRSVIYNNEVDVVVLGRETGKEMETVFQDDIADAKHIDLKAWRHRSFSQRVKEFFAHLWTNLL